jgi:hypothetical protein
LINTHPHQTNEMFKNWTRVSALLHQGIAAIPELRPKSGMGGRREKTAGPPGVYCFRIIPNRLGALKDKPITDVLTIGHTSDLTYRLGVFLGAAQGFALWHSAGKRFYHAQKVLGVGIDDLEFAYIKVSGKASSPKNLKKRLQLEIAATNVWRSKLNSLGEKKVLAARVRVGAALKKAGVQIRQGIILPVLMTNEPG